MKNRTIAIRLTENEYQQLKQIKLRHGKTISELFRQSLSFYSNEFKVPDYQNEIAENNRKFNIILN